MENESEAKPFKVTVRGPGVSIDQAVSSAAIPSLLSVIMGASSGDPGRIKTVTLGPRSSNASVGEFLSELRIRTNPERIAGIALFVRESLGRERVARDELPEWFQRAGQPAPKNLFRDLRTAVTQRLVTEDHARPGEYLVTETGIKTLRAQSEPVVAPATAARRTRPPRSGPKRAPTGADGPKARIEELLGEDWFSSPRTVADLLKEIAARGTHYKDSDVTVQMQQLVREHKLRRNKKTPEGSKREVWHYSKW